MARALPPCLVLLAFLSAPASAATDFLPVGAFSKEAPGAALPPPWQPFHFPKISRHTRYQFVSDAGVTVLRAEAEDAASGVVRPLDIDPRTYPILRWRWKVGNLIDKSDPTAKSGDDYPARLYLTFRGDPSRTGAMGRARAAIGRALFGSEPASGISYIWERALPKGSIFPNPYTDRVRMIVIESTTEKVGEWVPEERNVYEDYRRAFGEDPPVISGIAVMTDSDDTGTSATAWYGDISFHRAQP